MICFAYQSSQKTVFFNKTLQRCTIWHLPSIYAVTYSLFIPTNLVRIGHIHPQELYYERKLQSHNASS